MEEGDKTYSYGIPIAIGFISITGFIIRSLKIKNPLLKIDLFKKRNFTIPFIIIVICYLSNMSAVILMPLFVQTTLGFSATISGIVMFPAAMSAFVISPIGGRLFDKKGPRFVAVPGMFMMVLGTVIFCLFDKDISLIIVAAAYCLRMLGIGLAMMPLTAYAVGALKGEEISHGNAIIASMRQMFGTLGTTILVAVTVSISMTVSFAVQSVIFFTGFLLAILFLKNNK